MSAIHITAPQERQRTRAPRSVSSFRLSAIVRLLKDRSPALSGAALIAEEDRCLRAALPSLLEPSGRARTPGEIVLSWVDLHCPNLLAERGSDWIEDLVELPASRRHLKADPLGQALALTAEERTRLRIQTIGAIDQTKRQRAAARKAKDREYQKRKRLEAGATPREASIANAKPWEAEGVSRATWYRQKRASIGTVETTSSAVSLRLSTSSDEIVSLDARRSEGSPQAIPLAPRAIVVPARCGSISRRALEGLARRSAPALEAVA